MSKNISAKDKVSGSPASRSFEGKQMTLFQFLVSNSEDDLNNLSNTIELWDSVPKYYVSRAKQNKIRSVDGFLPSVERAFDFKGKSYSTIIRPARISKDGKEIEFYPSVREELVEDALRKLACNPGQGFLQNGNSGVVFSLHQLRKELKKRGHETTYRDLIDSLTILRRSSVEIRTINDKAVFETSPLTSLAGVSREDIKNDPSARWCVEFSSLVSRSIIELSHRQYNYGLMMSLKLQLSRYIHKRLSHNYKQASPATPYTISLKRIANDSGLLEAKRMKDNRRTLERAFEELKTKDVLMSFVVKKETRGNRNSLLDVMYELRASRAFTMETAKANKRAENLLSKP